MLNAAATPSLRPGTPPMPRDIRALLLDDNTFDRARIRRMSEKTNLSIQLDEVDSIAAMDEAVAQQNYDLLLIDYRLPVGDGMQALDHVMRNDLNRDAGKIMITGDGKRKTIMRAMKGGYHDFLSKEDMDAEGLRNAMLNAMKVARARLDPQRQSDRQDEMLRRGLIAALQDSEVQGNVISLFRKNLDASGVIDARLRHHLELSELDALLAGMDDADDFQFH